MREILKTRPVDTNSPLYRIEQLLRGMRHDSNLDRTSVCNELKKHNVCPSGMKLRNMTDIQLIELLAFERFMRKTLKDFANSIPLRGLKEAEILQHWEYRKGKTFEDIKQAVRKGQKAGRGKFEFEVSMIEVYLREVVKKRPYSEIKLQWEAEEADQDERCSELSQT